MSSVIDRKVEARKRAKNWREARLAKGECPKHNNSFSRLPCCYGCFSHLSAGSIHLVASDQNVPSPKVGEILKACFRCEQCGRFYHKGSYYFGENPRKRRWEKERPRGIQEGPEESLINYDKPKPGDSDRFLSLCGWCREEALDEWRYRRVSDWSGICDRHRPLARMESEPWQHPVCKAWVFPSPEHRHAEAGPRKRRMKVEFICLDQEEGEHRGITYLSQTKRDTWRGLCSKHQPKDDPKKFKEDIDITSEAGQVVLRLLFSQEDEQKKVPIFYSQCEHFKTAPRQTALAFLHQFRHKRRVLGQCQECRNNPEAFAERRVELALLAAGGSVGGQSEGRPQKRNPGHQPGDLILDRDRLKADFEEIVRNLRMAMPQRRILRRIIAEEYNRRGEPIHATTVTKRVQLIYGDGVSVEDAVARALGEDTV